MSDGNRDRATDSLNAHARTIDDLHHKLAALPGTDSQRLQRATEKYKTAHQQYHDDALGCMN